jgi:hypothetical protein
VLTWWLYNVLGVANLMLVPIGAKDLHFIPFPKQLGSYRIKILGTKPAGACSRLFESGNALSLSLLSAFTVEQEGKIQSWRGDKAT